MVLEKSGTGGEVRKVNIFAIEKIYELQFYVCKEKYILGIESYKTNNSHQYKQEAL